MPDGRKNNRGKIGNNGGRPPKVEEQVLVEKLSPLDPLAFDALEDGLRNKQQWAVKLYFEYMYTKPSETKNINLSTETIKNIIVENV